MKLKVFLFSLFISINSTFVHSFEINYINGGGYAYPDISTFNQMTDLETIDYINFSLSEMQILLDTYIASGQTSTNQFFCGDTGQMIFFSDYAANQNCTNYTVLVMYQSDIATANAFWLNVFPTTDIAVAQGSGGTGGGSGGGTTTTTTTTSFDISTLDTALAANYFAGGFAIFITPWAAAFGFSHLLKFIK